MISSENERHLNNANLYARSKKTARRQLFFGIWILSSALFAAIQLFLGTEWLIVGLAFISLVLCGIPLFLYGVTDIGSILVFFLLSKYSFFPLWIKTLFGERIDIGLRAPLNTFAIAVTGSLLCCAALILVNLISVRRRLLGRPLGTKQMLVAGYLATGFGLIFLTLHVIFGPKLLPTGEVIAGFGGFGSFISPLYFGLVCLLVIGLRRGANPIHRFVLVGVFIWIMFASLQANAKVHFTYAVMAVGLTVFYFRIPIKARYLLYTGGFILFYILIFAPVIQSTRTTEFKSADLRGKFFLLQTILLKNPAAGFIDQTQRASSSGYYYANSNIIDRFEMIQDLDIVASGITHSNTIGWVPVQWAFERSLPGFLTPARSPISDIDLIVYRAGYISTLRAYNRTIGVFGSAYAMFLWPGLIFVTPVVIALYLFVLKLLIPSRLSFNLFGVFFLVRYAFLFSEQSVQALLNVTMRGMLLDMTLLLIILFFITRVYPYSPGTVKKQGSQQAHA